VLWFLVIFCLVVSVLSHWPVASDSHSHSRVPFTWFKQFDIIQKRREVSVRVPIVVWGISLSGRKETYVIWKWSQWVGRFPSGNPFVNMVLNVHRNHKAYQRRDIIWLSLRCHRQNGSCLKMGSDESHFNVSLIVRDKVTRLCPQTTTFFKRKDSREESSRGPSAYLTDRPNRPTSPSVGRGLWHTSR